MERPGEGSAVRLADRMIDILSCLQSEASGLGLTDVSAAVGLSKSTTHRLLQSLEQRSLVVRDTATQQYFLGMGLVAMASGMLRPNTPLFSPCQPALEGLRDHSGETVTLQVVSGLERVCVRQVESPHTVRYSLEVGRTLPLYTGASGKLLLAYLPERLLERVIAATGLLPITANTITDPILLRAELQRVRSFGYAVSIEELSPLAAAVAVPVLGVSGEIVASLALVGPSMRLGKTRMTNLLPAVQATAIEVTRAISTKTRCPMEAAGQLRAS